MTEPPTAELDVSPAAPVEQKPVAGGLGAQSRDAPAQSLKRAVAKVAPSSVLVQLLSFGSSIVMATQIGARTSTDAYYLAQSVDVVVYAVLMVAIRMGGIPSLTAVARAEDPRATQRAVSELLSAIFVAASLLSMVLTLVMIVGLPSAAGGSGRLHALTREYLVELSPYAVTGAMLGGMGAVLAVRASYVPAMLVLGFEPVAKSVLVLLFRHQLGVQALVIGNLAGNFLAVLVLWAVLVRRGVHVRPRAFWSSKIVRGVFMLSAPLVLSQSLLQLNPLIDRTTAAAVGPGSVTVFEFGARLFAAPMALLGATLIVPLTASWSSKFQATGWRSVTDSFSRGITAGVTIVPPLVVAGLIARHDLVQFAYSSHAYTPESVNRTANVLGALLVGMVAQMMIVPLSALFAIRGDTIFPLKVGIANCVLNAVLDVALRVPFGVTGIAASTAITMNVLCGVYIREARKRWGSLGLEHVRGPALRSGVRCVLMAGLCLLVQAILPAGSSRLGALAATAALGAVAMLIQGPVVWMVWWPSRAVRAIGWIGLPRRRSSR